MLGFDSSTATRKAMAPSGTPEAWVQVWPRSLLQYAPSPVYMRPPPMVCSPVSAISRPPPEGVHATCDTSWIGRLSPTDFQGFACVASVDTSPFTACVIQMPPGPEANRRLFAASQEKLSTRAELNGMPPLPDCESYPDDALVPLVSTVFA